MSGEPYAIVRDPAGHWLVTTGAQQKPVALFYAHNVSDHVARRRAERFVEAMTGKRRPIVAAWPLVPLVR